MWCEYFCLFFFRDTVRTLRDVYDVIRDDTKHEKLTVDYACSNAWGNVFLDDGYKKLKMDLYEKWKNYINGSKSLDETNETQVIRDDTFCIYGVPGSGKSRLLMEFRDLVEENMKKILPIIITFNDKCNYSKNTEREINVSDVWKSIVCRIGFGLFGNNTEEGFECMRNAVSKMGDLFFEKLHWDTIVQQTVKYVNELKDKKYSGILLLVDEILKTNDNKGEIHHEFLRVFKLGLDDPNLKRDQLSFTFTILNSRAWLTHATPSNRKIHTYYLPHFGDLTMSQQLRNMPQNLSAKAIHACVLVNFRPRYLRDILRKFQDANEKEEKLEKDCVIAGISDRLFREMVGTTTIDKKLFDQTFTNNIYDYRKKLLGEQNLGDLTAVGILIPYARSKDTHSFDANFVPQVSLISIVKYLYDRSQTNDISEMESLLLKLMQGNLTAIHQPFEQFILVFEAFRFNAYFGNEAKLFRDYFKRAQFCNAQNANMSKKITFKCEKKFKEYERFDKLMSDLNSMDESARNNFARSYVFWFSDRKGDQCGFDGLIVYETESGEQTWTFFEPRYKEPTAKLEETEMSSSSVGNKIKSFNSEMSKIEEKFKWFEKERRLLLYIQYKTLTQRSLDRINSSPDCKDVALWFERVDVKESSRSYKFGITSHFGPTWTNLLSHFIAFKYPHTYVEGNIYEFMPPLFFFLSIQFVVFCR